MTNYNLRSTGTHYLTPLQPLRALGESLGVDLWVKRDDLTPVPGGGSKIRKLTKILVEKPSRTTAIVTTGGVQSNHARTTSLLAAKSRLHCELILHGDKEVLQRPTGNLLLMLLSGSRVTVVPGDRVADTIRSTMSRLTNEGHVPLLVEGGGHSVQGALGLVDAVLELNSQRPSKDWIPDYIVHASGTGGTQAGILAGVEILGWSTRVIGISVARGFERGRAIVRELYDQLRSQLRLKGKPLPVDFRENWIGGGYERPLPGSEQLVKKVFSLEGLPLDPTYTSKAMRGLFDLVEQGHIPRGSRVVFWHTGGLLNLLSANREWGFDE